MKYISQVKVSSEFLNQSNITEEVIFRDLAKKILSDMPYEDLQKLFKFTKIDPTSYKLNNLERFDLDINEFYYLENNRLIFFSAEVFFTTKNKIS